MRRITAYKAIKRNLSILTMMVDQVGLQSVKNLQIVFVCGADRSRDKNLRREFLEYYEGNKAKYLFFMAEDVIELISESVKNTDLMTIESKLAAISDCVILILESEGVFAELGAFSLSEELTESLLVINDKKFKDDNSFINLGPIAKINKESIFGSALLIDFRTISPAIAQIESRLSLMDHKAKRQEYEIKDFQEMKIKDRIAFLSDFIRIAQPITFQEMLECIKYLHSGHVEISMELGLLQTLKLITKIDNYYLSSTPGLFYDYKGKHIDAMRGAFLSVYHKNSRDRLQLLGR